jgi:hypothetical protein
MRTHKLSSEIMALRRQEADEWLLTQLTREVDPAGTPDYKKPYGLDLDRKELVIKKVKPSVPGASTWDRVDLVQTLLDHPDPAAFEKKLSNSGIKDGIQGLVK